jgi:hypothetical protein
MSIMQSLRSEARKSNAYRWIKDPSGSGIRQNPAYTA